MNTALAKHQHRTRIRKNDNTTDLIKKAADRVEQLADAQKSLEQKHEEVIGEIRDLAQHVAKGDRAGGSEPTSIGQQFIASEEFQNLQQHERGRATVTLKSTLTLDGASAGVLAPADRVGDVVALPRRKIRMRDVLSAGQTNSSSVEFVKQKTRTNTAAPVAETTAKPEATLAYELATAPVRTIAVTLPASRQVLSDAPMLASMVDNELRYMLADKEEQQLLSGDGTGSNLLGLIPQAIAFAPPFTLAAPTMIDVLLLAIAQNEAADFEADFIALNPLDWRRIQALKDTQGRYLANGPFSAEQVARLWQTPIVATKGIAADKFLVGDGRRGAQVFDRWQTRVEVSTEHADFFTKNMVMMLAEERLALAVYRPGAFIYGDFSDAITAATTP